MSELLKLPVVPRSLSEWLQVACDDLQTVCKRPDVRVNMHVFLQQQENRCYVCLAGSMLLATNLPLSNQRDSLAQVDSHTQQLLLAVNSMRLGLLDQLPRNFGIHGCDDDDTFNPYLRTETFLRLADLRTDPELMDPAKRVETARWDSSDPSAFFRSMGLVKARLIELGL